MYLSLNQCDSATSHATKHPNLTVLAWDGAVVGTRSGGYKAVDQTHVSQGSGFDAAKSSGTADADGAALGKCRLGDFHFFTLFLESQFGAKASDQQIAQNT
jgi:hypothetical protein